MTFADRDGDALAFARASAERNSCAPVRTCQIDWNSDSLEERFDLIVAAEVLYDSTAFVPLVRFLSAHLTQRGTVVLADAHRTDTHRFYEAMRVSGYHVARQRIRTREERLPLSVDLIRASLVPTAEGCP